jgi:hypothetical protein
MVATSKKDIPSQAVSSDRYGSLITRKTVPAARAGIEIE